MSYIGFGINAILENSTTPFDIYVKTSTHSSLEGEFTLYVKSYHNWAGEEIQNLQKFAIKTLYCEDKDYKLLNTYKKCSEIILNLKDNIPIKLKDINDENYFLNVFFFLLFCIFYFDISEKLIHALNTTIEKYLNLFLNKKPSSVFFKHFDQLQEPATYIVNKSLKVGLTLVFMARNAGHSKCQDLQHFFLGGLLHDLGKRKLSSSLMNKPGPLTQKEWETIFTHTQEGTSIIKPYSFSSIVYEIIDLHHEKNDGSGYPYQLHEQQIPLHTQWASAADIFNALTSHRCYGKNMSPYQALSFINKNPELTLSPQVFCLLAESTNG